MTSPSPIAASIQPQALGADDILGADDTKYAYVHVPEWRNAQGVEHVRIKSLSGVEIDTFRASTVVEVPALGTRPAQRKLNEQGFRAKFCALAIVNPAGARLFTDAQAEVLATRSNAALQRVYDAAIALSYADDAQVEKLASFSAAPPAPGDATS